MTNQPVVTKSAAQGYILILFLSFMGIMLLAISGVIQLVNLNNRETRLTMSSRQAQLLAEAGLEKAIAQINQNTNYTGETFTLSASGTTIGTVIVALGGSGNTRTISSTGYVPSSAAPVKTVTVKAQITGTAGGSTPIIFQNGVQVGDLGVIMKNNSSISGNVFSNGQVRGATNTAISGSVVSAGPSGLIKDFRELGIAGHVTANTVDRVMVAGNVKGRTCRNNSVISGNLWADTVTSCTVTGTTSPGVPDTAPQNLPITQAQIDAWKQTAEGGGVQNGNLELSSNTSLGPIKINGDLEIEENVILTITGTIWVTGELEIENGARLQLHSSYGVNEGVMVVDGPIHAANNMQALGSGQAGSYLMLLTTNSGTGHHSSAIDLHNGARGAIVYAQNGKIHLHNNALVKQATGLGLELDNNARLTFESGISNSNFIDVPIGGAWTLIKGTYQR